MESKGGLDEYLLSTCNCKLSRRAQILKKEIMKTKKELNDGVENGRQ